MKSYSSLFALAALALLLIVVNLPTSGKDGPQGMAASSAERGQHLVTLSGCDDCHSPKNYTEAGPQVDPARRLSGHPANKNIPTIPPDVIGPGNWMALTNDDLTAWAGPWGVSYAFNLTPDKKTGIGNWTLDTFKKVMRTGKDVSGQRDILPPMPWFNYAAMSDDEFQAVWNYLASLPPVNNMVPGPLPPAPMGQKPGTMEK
jgi:hypothetical protein